MKRTKVATMRVNGLLKEQKENAGNKASTSYISPHTMFNGRRIIQQREAQRKVQEPDGIRNA